MGLAFAKLKAFLRAARPRTFDQVCDLIAVALTLFTPDESAHYMRHCGYRVPTSMSKTLTLAAAAVSSTPIASAQWRLPSDELAWRYHLDACIGLERQQIGIAAHDRFGAAFPGSGQHPVIVRVAADGLCELRRLAPVGMLPVERQDGQVVRSQTELPAKCRKKLVPQRLRQNHRVLWHMDLEDLPAQPFGHDAGHDDVRVEDDPHEISANTSSSVKIPLALARGTATRRASASASCQSFR